MDDAYNRDGFDATAIGSISRRLYIPPLTGSFPQPFYLAYQQTKMLGVVRALVAVPSALFAAELSNEDPVHEPEEAD